MIADEFDDADQRVAVCVSQYRKGKAQPDELEVGDFVRWNSSGGTAQGRITRIERDGTINVPDSSFEINGEPDDPAALIRVYTEGEPTDTLVGHRFSTLTKIEPIKSDILTWHFKATDDEISERFSKYKATVNMSASELEAWSETECSKKASVDRSPIKRNLKLLRTPKSEWGQSEYTSAGRTISFVNRMKGAEQGEPASEGCPSKRDISLKNWAFDPNKSKSMNKKNALSGVPQQIKETKSFSLEVKEMREDEQMKMGYMEGYASTFGNVDLGGDIVEKGAFSKTLKDKGTFPLLEDHTPKMKNLLGFGKFYEDEKGLYGKFEINLDTEQGRAAYSLAKQARKMGNDIGMSIGYETVKEEYDRENSVRRLKELKLFEVSMTLFPMNEQAGVTMVKSTQQKELNDLMEIKSFIESLLNDEPSGKEDTHAKEADQLAEIKQLIQQLSNK